MIENELGKKLRQIGFDAQVDKKCPEIEMAKYIMKTKAWALLDAVRKTDVGSDIIIHNEDKSVWCVLTVKCKEHDEVKDEDGGLLI